jgi:ethanolamine ammonia-lyase small subunit
MTEENPTPQEEAAATPPEESESEDSELEDLLKEMDSENPPTREEFNALKKGVAKFFSQKGRENKETKEVKEPKEAPTQSSDDVTELFLESKPEAELVKDELKTIADKLYDGSIIKAWKNETWLHTKAQSLSEENKAKGKIQSPSNQIEGEVNFSQISKMEDAQQGEAIKKMSSKDYEKWQEYQRKRSVTPGRITL